MTAQKLLFISLVVIFIGILLLIIASLLLASQSSKESKIKNEVGVGGFIGPIPFGFFTSRKIFWIWLAFFIAFLVVWFFILRKVY